MEIPCVIRMKLKDVWTARRATSINLQQTPVPVNMRWDVPNAPVPMMGRGRSLLMMTKKMGFAIRMRSMVVRIQMRAITTLMPRMIAAIANIPLDVTVAQVHPMDRASSLTTIQTTMGFVMQMR